mgnify:CR=1 FL=1
MAYTQRCLYLIPAAARTVVNAALAVRGYGPNTFSVDLRTRFACSWQMTAAEKADVESVLASLAPGWEVVEYSIDTDRSAPEREFTARSLKRVVSR